jgi:hypothetical protein
MIKLKSLHIKPKGVAGLGSPILKFGEHITQFSGDNRSGKTPMIQTLVFCLGYPISFRQDLLVSCSSATLDLTMNGRQYSFERVLSSDSLTFDLKVASDDSQWSFNSELDFSRFFFDRFGLLPINLIDLGGRSAAPYISTVLPLFYLDQDFGYGEIYKPQKKFIRDQFLEMVRYVFGFSAKNSFDADKLTLRYKAERGSLDEMIAGYKASQAKLAETLGSVSEDLLKAQLSLLNSRLTSLWESKGEQSESLGALKLVRENLSAQRWALDSEVRDLSLRIDGYEKIKSEIEAECDALSLNATAKRLFESLGSICQNEQCGLFRSSEHSYAKNLLYLKDQLKDLEFNIESVRGLRSSKLGQLTMAIESLDVLKAEGARSESDTPVESLVKAVNEVTRSIVDAEQKLTSIEQSKNFTLKIANLEAKREGLSNQIDASEAKGRTADGDMQWLRSTLRDATVRWLNVLETEGVDRNIKIDAMLNFEFGSEQLSSFKGSTKVRAVLAVHAALFEVYLQKVSAPMSLLVFDTPNQQELENTDLTNFMRSLKALCRKFDAQVVFASKDFKLSPDERDIVHAPTFPGEKHAMYLGEVGDASVI